MKISEAWLREYANPGGDLPALLHQLTMQGLEVEGVEAAGLPLPLVVVGRVVGVAAHPNGDRLRVCQVDVGTETLQIVCGAANVRVGGLYAVALVGAHLPGDRLISSATLRGAASAGMLCSSAELGLSDLQGGEGLLELEQRALPGTALSTALGLDDQVIDLKITPNRADCFSLLGVARDLAATAGIAWTEPRVPAVAAQDHQTISLLLEDPAGSPVFSVRSLRGINPEAVSPWWLRERLRRSGIRSVHPVVDVTNLVMLELGQPLHAYDLDQLAGGLVVRRGRAGEALELLTGATVQLDEEFLVIGDDQGAVGVAGIMGGNRTAISAATRNVLLESAFFAPGVIGGRARRLGLQSDAATRFERGVDPAGQQRALERATELLLGITGGTAGVCQTAGPGVALSGPVSLRRQRLADVLGIVVPAPEVEKILQRLGMRVVIGTEHWEVYPPSFRFDINLEVDLIEEVARVYGYDRIPPEAGLQTTCLGTAPAHRLGLEQIRGALVQRGYQEAITYSFVDREKDRLFAGGGLGMGLINPLSPDMAVLRQSLWPGLVGALKHNLDRQQRRVRLFEMGVRFLPGEGGLTEETVIGGIAFGSVLPEQWGNPGGRADFFAVKGDLEALLALGGDAQEFAWEAAVHPALHPGRSARVSRGTRLLGWLGVLHPTLVQSAGLDEAPLLFELSAHVLGHITVSRFQGVSRFPAVRRDLAVLVPVGTPVASLVAAVRAAAGAALQEVRVFDIYTGGNIELGEKSIALGLIFQERSRTLLDLDAEKIVADVVARLAADCNARVRLRQGFRGMAL